MAGANVHATKRLAPTLESLVVARPPPTEGRPQHLRPDKGYDHPTGYETVAACQDVSHLRGFGEAKLDAHGQKTYPAHRWVVERTRAWWSNVGAFWSAMRRTPAISSVYSNWPGPSCGCGSGHDSSVIDMVSKSNGI
jgi:hypothetical protein